MSESKLNRFSDSRLSYLKTDSVSDSILARFINSNIDSNLYRDRMIYWFKLEVKYEG